MVTAITHNAANYDGHVVTVWCDTTAAGQPCTVTLPTHAPWIDLRIGHPILGGAFHSTTAHTNSEPFDATGEMERGVAPDSAVEWAVTAKNTISIYKSNDEAGHVAITYIAFGNQKA